MLQRESKTLQFKKGYHVNIVVWLDEAWKLHKGSVLIVWNKLAEQYFLLRSRRYDKWLEIQLHLSVIVRLRFL